MKMLEVPEYALLEIHEHCERRLGLDEKPLLVQLNWHREDRDGRFLLRSLTPEVSSTVNSLKTEQKTFKRSLSVRMKKVFSKQHDKVRKLGDEGDRDVPDAKSSPALKRSLTNPDSVLERRRLHKPMPSPSPLVIKNQGIDQSEPRVPPINQSVARIPLISQSEARNSLNGQSDSTILVKIQSELPNRNVPLLVVRLAPDDTCGHVLSHVTLKYNLPPHLVKEYCLVFQHGVSERYLHDQETPYSYIVNNREAILILRRRHSNYSDHESVLSFDSGQFPRHHHHHVPWHHPPPLEFEKEEILPAVLEFSDDTEDELFSAIITHLDPSLVSFKLGPAYIIYMATRY